MGGWRCDAARLGKRKALRRVPTTPTRVLRVIQSSTCRRVVLASCSCKCGACWTWEVLWRPRTWSVEMAHGQGKVLSVVLLMMLKMMLKAYHSTMYNGSFQFVGALLSPGAAAAAPPAADAAATRR